MDQFVLQVLQNDKEHAKLPDLEVAQVDVGLELYARADDLQLELSAVTGPAGEPIDAHAVASLLDLFGDQVGVADGDAPDEAGRAKEPADRAGGRVHPVGVVLQVVAMLIASLRVLREHSPAGVTKIALALLAVGWPLLLAVVLEGIAGDVRLEAPHNLLDVAAKDALERATGDEYLLPLTAKGQHRRHIGSADAGVAGLDQQRPRRGYVQRAKRFVDQFFQHRSTSLALRKDAQCALSRNFQRVRVQVGPRAGNRAGAGCASQA